jgi:hypothetical protein
MILLIQRRQALGEKVKFVTLKLPSYKLQTFTGDNWRDGVPSDEFDEKNREMSHT